MITLAPRPGEIWGNSSREMLLHINIFPVVVLDIRFFPIFVRKCFTTVFLTLIGLSGFVVSAKLGIL